MQIYLELNGSLEQSFYSKLDNDIWTYILYDTSHEVLPSVQIMRYNYDNTVKRIWLTNDKSTFNFNNGGMSNWNEPFQVTECSEFLFIFTSHFNHSQLLYWLQQHQVELGYRSRRNKRNVRLKSYNTKFKQIFY